MRPIDSLLSLEGMRLYVVLHFQSYDEILSNSDDKIFIKRLKQANKKGVTHIRLGDDGGHNSHHRTLWRIWPYLVY